MTIEQAIDQVQIAMPAAPGTDGELTGQMRLGACRESGDFFVLNMCPLNLAVAADGIGNAVEAVADNAIDTLHTRCGQGFRELISYSPSHPVIFPLSRRLRG